MSAINLKRAVILLVISVLALGLIGCDTQEPTGVPVPDLAAEGKPSGGGSGGGGGGKGGGGSTSPATFGGNATALKVSDAQGTLSTFAKIPLLSAQGGAFEASFLEASLATATVQALNAQSLHATIVAQGDRNRAESSVSDFSVSLGGQTITASFLMARATVLLSRGVTGSGISRVENLSINGKPVAVTGKMNQQVNITNFGTLIINEQHFGSGFMTVRALHISTPNADIVVSEAFAGMTAGSTVCGSNDFATGGGWILGTPSGSRASFGVAGGMNAAGTWGHLEFVDQGSGSKVHGTGVTSYVVVNSTSRHIDGTCDIDGQPSTYSLDLTDNGEPGTSDTFNLVLSNGYQAAGTLSGGNVQLHAPCR
jgi:hypothetical protein